METGEREWGDGHTNPTAGFSGQTHGLAVSLARGLAESGRLPAAAGAVVTRVERELDVT